jgi:epsilon-lactone hydrolase
MSKSHLIDHPASPKDLAVVAAIAAQSAPFKGMMTGPEARVPYDEMIAAIPGAEDVTHDAAMIGGVSGYWCRTTAAPGDAAILYLHGGGYVLGSAKAYRNFASQFAAHTGINVFVPDYSLAPERPFPGGVQDARAVWKGLEAQGFRRMMIVGDSAGGGLSLSLLEWASTEAAAGRGVAPIACVVMSPWTDLSQTGDSYASKAESDPYLTKAMLQTLSELYLGKTAPDTSAASPLYGNLAGLPPIQIHVGTNEVLLDDSLTYANRVHAAGGLVTAHVWQDMPHVFPSSFATLEAGEAAMQLMATFIRQQMTR